MPHHATVATKGLWCVASRVWHEPPPDTCSVASAGPSHSRSIKIIISDFHLFYMRFPVGHSILIKSFVPWRVTHSPPASHTRISSQFLPVIDTGTAMRTGPHKRCTSRTWMASKSLWATFCSIANAFSKRFAPSPSATTAFLPPSTLR